jgi:arginase
LRQSPLIPLGEVVATAVADVLAAQQRPVMLCGDRTIALAIVAWLQRAGLDRAIIWLDAHGDVQTVETRRRVSLAGCVAAQRRDVLTGRVEPRPVFSPEKSLS